MYFIRVYFQSFRTKCTKVKRKEYSTYKLPIHMHILVECIKSMFLSPLQPHNNNKFKTSMCRDHSRGGCPRGIHCTFAHSEEELEK